MNLFSQIGKSQQWISPSADIVLDLTFFSMPEAWESISFINLNTKRKSCSFCSYFVFIDFMRMYEFMIYSRLAMEETNNKIVTGDKKIKLMLKEISDVVKINKLSPEWINYIRAVASIVNSGLQKSIVLSLKSLFNRMVLPSLHVSPW